MTSLIVFYLLTPMLAAQNLILDSSFEQLDTPTCLEPDENFFFTAHWYPLSATPDLIATNCPLDENGLLFWKNDLAAFEGKNYAGLSCRFNSNGSFNCESIATALSEPLSKGLYAVEVAVRNKGFYQGFADSLLSCPLRPDRRLDIYLAQDSIAVIEDISSGQTSLSAPLITEFRDAALESLEANDEWRQIATCFQAQGGEQHLAVAQPLGNFGVSEDCINEDNAGTFHTFYFDIDDLRLQAIPPSIELEIEFCQASSLEFDLLEQLEQRIFKQADYEWADGFIGAKRSLTTAGIYEIDAVLSCGTVAITLEVRTIPCERSSYIPTAFSPNGDGSNDFFEVYFSPAIEVENYQLSIFNRWGGLVFQSSDPSAKWDGTADQQTANGLYLWQLQYGLKGDIEAQIYQLTGTVLLNR